MPKMPSPVRKRVALGFSTLGIALMGVDLLMTRSVFVHVGELMLASLVCLVLGIVIDRDPPEGAPRSLRSRVRDLARRRPR